jgi:hypothetical protein
MRWTQLNFNKGSFVLKFLLLFAAFTPILLVVTSCVDDGKDALPLQARCKLPQDFVDAMQNDTTIDTWVINYLRDTIPTTPPFFPALGCYYADSICIDKPTAYGLQLLFRFKDEYNSGNCVFEAMFGTPIYGSHSYLVSTSYVDYNYFAGDVNHLIVKCSSVEVRENDAKYNCSVVMDYKKQGTNLIDYNLYLWVNSADDPSNVISNNKKVQKYYESFVGRSNWNLFGNPTLTKLPFNN